MEIQRVELPLILKASFIIKKVAFVSFHAPNTFDVKSYSLITHLMLDLVEYRFIIGAYFNAEWDHSIDWTAPVEGRDQRLASTALKK